MNLYIGLVHHPIKNKRGDIVTTSVTNLDVHDIARSTRTFGFKSYFIITPIQAQHDLLERMLGHWKTDKANDYNPDRQDALGAIELVESIEQSMAKIEAFEGKKPIVTVTGANFKSFMGTTQDLADKLKKEDRPLFPLFGTGWGLADSVLEMADYSLEPIFGAAEDGYNHLSVRSAVAIYLHDIAKHYFRA